MNKTVEQFQELAFNGDIIPHTWYETPLLKRKNGKPNMVAIILLANICYWYRPTVELDEATNTIVGIKQRFTYDKLRMFYQQWADKYGYSKRQVQDAIAFLKRAGLIIVELRTVRFEGGAPIANVPHVEPVFKKIKEITVVKIKEKTPISRYNVTPIPLERETYPVTTVHLSRYNVGRKSKTTDEITNKTTDETTQTDMGGAAPIGAAHAYVVSADMGRVGLANSLEGEPESFSKGEGSPQAVSARAGAGRAASVNPEPVSASGPARKATEAPVSGSQASGPVASRAVVENATAAPTAPTQANDTPAPRVSDEDIEYYKAQPAIRLFKEVMGRWPNRVQMEEMCYGVWEEQLEVWEELLHKWLMSGYNPTNVRGMLDALDNPYDSPLWNNRATGYNGPKLDTEKKCYSFPKGTYLYSTRRVVE